MLQQLKGHLQESEIKRILSIILSQYRKYLRFQESEDYQNLFADEYAPHKKQHGVSWAISSGFKSNTNVIDGINISCLKYGKGHTRPELSNSHIVIHILNHTSHFDAAFLNNYYKMNNFPDNPEKIYCYFKFVVDHNKLKQISLCVPAVDGTIISEELLIGTNEIIRLVA